MSLIDYLRRLCECCGAKVPKDQGARSMDRFARMCGPCFEGGCVRVITLRSARWEHRVPAAE